jgi:hypothetical protein
LRGGVVYDEPVSPRVNVPDVGVTMTVCFVLVPQAVHHSTVYEIMDAPPSLAGSLHERVSACSSNTLKERSVGTVGSTANGLTVNGEETMGVSAWYSADDGTISRGCEADDQ